MARSVFDVSPEAGSLAALVEAAKFARAHGQLVAWDNSDREYAIAIYHEEGQELQALSDEEAAILLNRDLEIRRAWKKWNAVSKNRGSLIVLDSKRVLQVLANQTNDPQDDEITGLA